MSSETTASVTPVLTPAGEKRQQFEEHAPLYHVVLLDDDEHTYDYVIEMLQKLFLMPKDVAFQHAVEVDTTGRTIVITCELRPAEGLPATRSTPMAPTTVCRSRKDR